ncbi:hypothetical protein E4U32_003488 [Claviceps aff. humidiphila group G2b]|nr:hypothetical protein E4U32_003488 [Claviceps aff. humidiphila group G2b]
MSSRQLRKLQQQKELERAQRVDQPQRDADKSDDVQEAVQTTAKPRPNLFAALGGEDEDAGEEDDDDGQDAGPSLTAQDDEAAEPSAKKSKKKKKKKSKKAKSATAAADDEDEIDRAIKELQSKSKSGAGSHSHGQSGQDGSFGPRKRMNELLSIDTHHLRAINEMRSLFGREVIESANAEEQHQEQGNRRRQRMHQEVDLETFLREPPGAKKLPDVSLRRNVFIQGREHWPCQSAGGLTMSKIGESSDGLSTEYAYVHEKEYDSMQAFFFACVQIGDPMRMIHLLKGAPYHVSTLLQVSSVAKQDQNMALSAELLERALFTFGRVATSAFRQDIESGRARLDFRRPENRQFWLAGYQYLRSLIRKGTYRTALEWAKLLFALDRSDPYAIRHYMHVLALRAYQSTWLIDFFQEMGQLGNCHGDVDRYPGDQYLRQSLVLAKLQANDTEGARELLKSGIQSLPWLYCALFQELNLDAPPSIWGIKPATDTASFWVKMYIDHTKDLWNNPQAIALLQQVAKSQETKPEVSSLASEDDAVDLGSARLAYLEGQTTLLAITPRHLLDSQPNYEFDPLPPPQHDNIFTSESTQLPWRDNQPQRSQNQPPDDLLARMQNLLARRDERARRRAAAPAGVGIMNNIGGNDNEEDDEEARAIQEADDEELQRDIEAHMDWVNEPGFLGTLMRLLGVGAGAQGAEDEDDDEDDDVNWMDVDDDDEYLGLDPNAEVESDDEYEYFIDGDDVPPGAWPEEY